MERIAHQEHFDQPAAVDPLGDGDWPAMMRANIEALAAALEGDE